MSLTEGGLARLNWRKAMRSMNTGACVEVASAADTVAVRDSQDLRGPVVRYPSTAWRSFVAARGPGASTRSFPDPGSRWVVASACGTAGDVLLLWHFGDP